jgi:hypothetical protein
MTYLKLHKQITIPKTSGKNTIAKSKDFYYLDSDFKNYGTDVKSKATKVARGEIFDLTKSGTFKEIYEDFGQDLDKLTFTQDQILSVIKNIQDDVYDYFFLFKIKDEFFVAGVGWRDGQLGVYAYRFSGDSVWDAEGRHRVVVPQLVPSDPQSSPLDSLTLSHLEKRLAAVEARIDSIISLKKVVNKIKR